MGVDKPNYTQVANLILDDLMRYMSGAELKITLAIARQTFGYHRERFPLTISDLETLTGLSRPAVVEGVSDGERRGMIKRELIDGRMTYSLVINDEVLAVGKQSLPVKKVNRDDGKESLPLTVKKVNRRSKESLPISVNKVDRYTPGLKKEKETSKERKEDDLPPHIQAVWLEAYGEPMPINAKQPVAALVANHPADAVIHGIKAAAAAGARTVSYIARCAENYIPPAPVSEAPHASRYSVDVPGVMPLSPVPRGDSPPPTSLPAPLAHDDPWAVCLAEMLPTMPGAAISYLTGSRLEAAGERAGKRLYRVVVESRAAAGLDWLRAQAGPAIKRKLGSIVGPNIDLEIVAAPAQEDPTP